MPIRIITIPPPVAILDPITRKPALDPTGAPQTCDFALVLSRLMANPVWSETYAAMRAQAAIMDAFERADGGQLELAEEDWLKLKAAAESPRTHVDTAQGPQLVAGLGMHPAVSRQVVPLLAAIVEAKTK